MKNLISTLLLFASFSLLAQKNGHYLSATIGIPLVYKTYYGAKSDLSLSMEYQFIKDKNGFGLGLQLEHLKYSANYTGDPNVVIATCKYQSTQTIGLVYPSILYSLKGRYLNLNLPVYYLRSLYSTKKISLLAKVGFDVNSNIYRRFTYKYPVFKDTCTLADLNPSIRIETEQKLSYLNIDALADMTFVYKVSKKIAITGSLQYHYLILKKSYFFDTNRLSLFLGSRFKL
jgi:hypothetical protein